MRPPVERLGRHKFYSSAKKRTVEAECVSVDFYRLMRTKTLSVDSLIDNRELLHALVALYNTCLPNIEPDVLYATICGKHTKTIMLLLSPEDALHELCFRYGAQPIVDCSIPSNEDCGDAFSKSMEDFKRALSEIQSDFESADAIAASSKRKVFSEQEETEAKEKCPNCRDSKFAEVFSDEEDDESSEDEEEEEDDDYSEGSDQFIDRVHYRRAKRQEAIDAREGIKLSSIHIENRLIAAITFEKSFIYTTERIHHITVLSVRKRYRGFRLGQGLLDQTKDPRVVDPYDTLVVLADDDAVEFFEKQSFSQDVILCSRYQELEGTWTNCTVMIYVPPFFAPDEIENDENLISVDKAVEKWQEQSARLYQQQLALIYKLKNEVKATRNVMAMQQKIMSSFSQEVEQLSGSQNRTQAALPLGEDIPNSCGDTSENIKAFQNTRNSEVSDEVKLEILANFAESLRETNPKISEHVIATDVEMLTARNPISGVLPEYDTHELYYCGTLSCEKDLENIVSNGLTESSFTHGDYGIGLYFTRHAEVAMRFSKVGAVLLCEVKLGNTNSTMNSNQNRRDAGGSQFHSLLNPGRMSLLLSPRDERPCQEYIVFNPSQAVPKCIIKYSS